MRCWRTTWSFRGQREVTGAADAFWPALEGFAAMTKWARIVELLVAGDAAAVLYDCELPEPVGTLMIAPFFRVENEIRRYETLFDATELRKLQPK
jgi:hypothetical protein